MNVKQRSKTFEEFLAEFVAQQQVPHGYGFHVLVTPEDCQRVGELVIRGMICLAAGYDLQPRLRNLDVIGIVVEKTGVEKTGLEKAGKTGEGNREN